MASLDARATAATRARYDRIAWFYDRMEKGAERRIKPLRAALWHRVRGPRVLEVGVGTGKNMPYYPGGMSITAVDLSPKMLAQARERAARLGVAVDLREADVQSLPFAPDSFDAAITTCVFCSVPDPVVGLSEVRRVLVPGGQLLMMEHVLSHKAILRQIMQALNPVVVRIMGANINRDTVTNVQQAGFIDLCVDDVMLDILKLIEARTVA